MDSMVKHIVYNKRKDIDNLNLKLENMPLVSAIVTTYKREPDIVKRAVQSVVNQSYPSMELIVVNDCPLETELVNRIEKMLSGIQTEFEIHYIVVAENGGACKARNIGICEAKGEYIACLDDDDEWKPEKIKTYIEVAERNSEVGIVYGGIIVKNEKSGVESSTTIVKPSGDIFMQELAYNIIGSCSFPLLRKSVVDSVGGFREDMPALQDWELFLRMLKQSKAVYIVEPLNVYHIYEGERISTNPMKRVEAYEKLKIEHSTELMKNNVAAASFYLMGCYFYGLKLDLKKGFYYWRKAVIKNPINIKKNVWELIKLMGRCIMLSKNI